MDCPINHQNVRYIVRFQRMGGESDYYKVVDNYTNRLVEKDLDLVSANRLKDKLNGLCKTIAYHG